MKRERKLGYWETIKTLTHDNFNGTDIVVFELFVKGNLNVEILNLAFEKAYQHHTMLGTTIHQENDIYYFRSGLPWKNIPFNIIQDNREAIRHNIMEAEIAHLFPTQEYLFRITLLKPKLEYQKDHFLYITFHHAICDGTCVLNFLDEVLTYYQQLENGLPLKEQEILPLAKPQDELLPLDISWPEYLNQMTQYQAINGKGWQFHKIAAISARIPRFISKRIPITIINDIRKQCQQQKVSLNDFLNALALKTKFLLDNKSYEGTVCTWVNTRGKCNPEVSNKIFGYYVNSIASKHMIDDNTNIWDLAQDYHLQLHNSLLKLSHFPKQGFNLEQAKAAYQMDLLSQQNNFLYDFSLTYLSQLPLKSHYGSLNILETSLAINITAATAGIILAIFTFGTEINFMCYYTEPLIEKIWVEQYMDLFENLLRKEAGSY